MTINNELCDIMDLKEKSQITELFEESLKINEVIDYDKFKQKQKHPSPPKSRISRNQKEKKKEKINFKHLISIQKRNAMFQEQFEKENNLYTMTQQLPSKKIKKVSFNLNNYTKIFNTSKKVEKNTIKTVNEDQNSIILKDLLNYIQNFKNKQYYINLTSNNKKFNYVPFQRNNSSDKYPVLNTNLLKLISESTITKRSSNGSYEKKNSNTNDNNEEDSVKNILNKIQVINANKKKNNKRNNEEDNDNLDNDMNKPIIVIEEKKKKCSHKKLPLIRLVKPNLINFVRKMDNMDINLKKIKRDHFNSFNEKEELTSKKIFKTEYNSIPLNLPLNRKHNNNNELNSDKSESDFSVSNNKYYTKLQKLLSTDYKYNHKVINKYFQQKRKKSNQYNSYSPIIIKQSKPKNLYKRKNKNFLSPAHYKSFEIMNQIKQREKKNQDKKIFAIFRKNI